MLLVPTRVPIPELSSVTFTVLTQHNYSNEKIFNNLFMSKGYRHTGTYLPYIRYGTGTGTAVPGTY